MEYHDINWSSVISHTNTALGYVFCIVESDDGRQSARQEIEAPN